MFSIAFPYILWLLSTSVAVPAPETTAPLIEGINAIDDFTPQELVEDIFVKGACKNIFNIEVSGHDEGVGYFEGGGDVIGLSEGIILSTGDIEDAEGPNNSVKDSGKYNLPSDDPDLRRLSGSDTIMDIASLEFDFIPLERRVTFRYVFASEEYCEYVDDVFNDVFGFFVSGPGIDGPFADRSENVALIPESNDFVTINSVNHKTNSDYFISNIIEEDALECGIPYTPPPQERTIQFDGFTKVLTATLDLIPCEVYHLRLVVADVGDDSWDSAVFLEAESFNIGGDVELEAYTTVGNDTIPEGCDYGYFQVSRIEGEPLDQDITIGLRIGETSTAVEGVDFAPIPKSVTIPAGSPSIDVPIQLLIDDEAESRPEGIIMEFDFPCACISDTARLFVQDPLTILSGVPDQEICKGDSVSFRTAAAGGVPGYEYQWSTGATTPDLTVYNIQEDQNFQLSITDACGRLQVDEIRVDVRKVPQVFIPNDIRETCIGESILVPVSFDGAPPYQFSIFVDGNLEREFRDVYQNPFNALVETEGNVTVGEYHDANCPGEAFGMTELRFYRIQTVASSSRVSCFGGNDGRIDTEVAGGNPPYTFDWGGGIPNEPDPDGLPAGLYTGTITDAQGCQTTLEVEIKEPSPIRPIDFECREFRGEVLQFGTSGGSGPYLYSIDGGPFEDVSIFNNLTGGQSYDLRIQDAQGCLLQQNFIMPVLRDRIVDLPQSLKLDLGQRTTLMPQLNIPESLIGQITWTPADNLSCTDCLNPELTALEDQTYRIRIDDVFGCVDGAAIAVKLDKQPSIYIPTAFSPDGDEHNDLLTIFANPEQVREIESFRVFSRWGLLVYEARNILPNREDIGWDGTHAGRPLDPGTFIYTTTAILTNGARIKQNGTVNLIR